MDMIAIPSWLLIAMIFVIMIFIVVAVVMIAKLNKFLDL